MSSQVRVSLTLLCALAALLAFWTSGSPADAAGALTAPACAQATRFDPANFSNPTTIDNKWLPLVPGTQFTLQGYTLRGRAVLPHRVVFTVTDLTKFVNGVRSVVVWDRDINEGQLQEAELAFFA